MLQCLIISVGYINLSTFSGNPSKEFKKAFLDLKKQGATSLVIDLRRNGGGLLDEAVGNCELFLATWKSDCNDQRENQAGEQYL